MTKTKIKYINEHPRSMLTSALINTDWPDDQKIEIIGGLLAPENKNSNLYAALKRSKMGKYVKGGHRQRGTQGWWIAVA